MKRVKRSAYTKGEAVRRLHEACAQRGASSWMKLPPPPPVTAGQMSEPRPPRSEANPTTLYRFFDCDSRLLYVGISTDPRKRIANHRTHKPWWTQSVRIEMEHYGSWDEARSAEKSAIKTESPLYNLADVPSETEQAIARLRKRYRTDPEFRQSFWAGLANKSRKGS